MPVRSRKRESQTGAKVDIDLLQEKDRLCMRLRRFPQDHLHIDQKTVVDNEALVGKTAVVDNEALVDTAAVDNEVLADKVRGHLLQELGTVVFLFIFYQTKLSLMYIITPS